VRDVCISTVISKIVSCRKADTTSLIPFGSLPVHLGDGHGSVIFVAQTDGAPVSRGDSMRSIHPQIKVVHSFLDELLRPGHGGVSREDSIVRTPANPRLLYPFMIRSTLTFLLIFLLCRCQWLMVHLVI
jgi:hypothetical protein